MDFDDIIEKAWELYPFKSGGLHESVDDPGDYYEVDENAPLRMAWIDGAKYVYNHAQI